MAGKKQSHNYQLQNSNSYANRPRGLRVDAAWYTIYLFLGIIVGIVAFVINTIQEYFTLWRIQATDKYDRNQMGLAWIVYTAFGVLYVLISAILTVYVGPGAVGSGTAELMGYTNGVRYPNFLAAETLIVKIFGVALAVSGGLHIGKQGPLAHIGSNIGAALIFFPTTGWCCGRRVREGCNTYFRNQSDLRKIIAAGAGVGVATAFASPIGGTIFAYEVTRPHVYWSFTLLLKTFWASSLSTFILNVLISAKQKDFIGLGNAGLIKFGQQLENNPFKMEHLPFVIISGIICGVLGAIFVWGNVGITKLRKKFLKSKLSQVIEAVVVVIITATIVFVLPLAVECTPITESLGKDKQLVSYTCEQGYYNKLATLLWETEGAVIKVLFASDVKLDYQLLIIFFLVWYILTMFTYGTAVPAGLFFPGILMGCALGLLLGELWNTFIDQIPPTTYAIACASGILCGYSRLSLSLVVLVIQTTQNIDLFLPVLLNTLAALWFGQMMNKSLYVNAVIMKGIPFLPQRVPAKSSGLNAKDIMAAPIVCFKEIESVKQIYKILESTEYHGFPVLNYNGQLTGLISRNQIITAMFKKMFVVSSRINSTPQIKMPAGSEIQLNEDGEFLSGKSSSSKEKFQGPNIEFSQEELRASLVVPQLQLPFNWYDFNIDFQSTQYNYRLVTNIYEEYPDQLIDLRAFMLETPSTVPQNLPIQRCLELFRRLSLRHLPVIEQFGTKVIGIITRKDFIEGFKKTGANIELQNDTTFQQGAPQRGRAETTISQILIPHKNTQADQQPRKEGEASGIWKAQESSDLLDRYDKSGDKEL